MPRPHVERLQGRRNAHRSVRLNQERFRRRHLHEPQDRQFHPGLPVVEGIRPYIEELRKRGGSPYFFPAKFEGAIVEGQSTVRRKAHDYAKKSGVKVIKLHEFRHSCVSNLWASGLSVRVVSRWVGDTERMVQETYSHLLPSEKDVINDFFDAMTSPATTNPLPDDD